MLIFMEWKCCEPDDPPGFTSMPGVMSVNMRFGRICVLVFLAMTLLGSGSVFAAPANPGDSPVEKRPEGFDTPELSRSRFLGWIRRDLSRRIPGEETLIKQYLDEWKFQFETLTINKRIFAINIDVDNKFPYDITLLDVDCDGIYETKVEEKPGQQRVDMPIPECVFRVSSEPAR